MLVHLAACRIVLAEEDGQWAVVVLDTQDVTGEVVEATVSIDHVVVVDDHGISCRCTSAASEESEEQDDDQRSS